MSEYSVRFLIRITHRHHRLLGLRSIRWRGAFSSVCWPLMASTWYWCARRWFCVDFSFFLCFIIIVVVFSRLFVGCALSVYGDDETIFVTYATQTLVIAFTMNREYLVKHFMILERVRWWRVPPSLAHSYSIPTHNYTHVQIYIRTYTDTHTHTCIHTYTHCLI